MHAILQWNVDRCWGGALHRVGSVAYTRCWMWSGRLLVTQENVCLLCLACVSGALLVFTAAPCTVCGVDLCTACLSLTYGVAWGVGWGWGWGGGKLLCWLCVFSDGPSQTSL